MVSQISEINNICAFKRSIGSRSMPENEKLTAMLVDHYLLYSWFSSLKVDESILSTVNIISKI